MSAQARWIALAAAALVGGAVSLVALGAARPPEGPVDPVWDRTPCAHCTMLVGDRAFAAQLQTADARVLDFDDPGCLFLLEAESRPAAHATWFRHARADRWVRGDAVAFIEVTPTPMGFGLGAVDAGTPGAITLEAARARVLSKPKTEGR